MRESMGGAFLIKIMVVFIVLYNSLLAIAVNYAMVFRVKNRIIDLLEQYEGCEKISTACSNDSCVKQYINSVGYYRANAPVGGGKNYKIEAIGEGNRGTRYKVTTYITFAFPIVGDWFNISITGETKTIYGVYEDSKNNPTVCAGV